MSGFKEPSYADRQKAAQQARQEILNKFRTKPGPDDPAMMQRRAEREAQAAARAKAREAREVEKAEQKRLEAEAAAAAAAELARAKNQLIAQILRERETVRYNTLTPDEFEQGFSYVFDMINEADHGFLSSLLAREGRGKVFAQLRDHLLDDDRFERNLARLLDGIERDLRR